jgi:hypothetical protein
MTEPTCLQGGRLTETRQQLSENNLRTESVIWSQVAEWARFDILTDWPSFVTWLLKCSDHWVITLQIADPSSRQRGRPTETRLQISDSNITIGRNIWSHVPQRCSITKYTEWLTVSRKVTSTSTKYWRLLLLLLLHNEKFTWNGRISAPCFCDT